MVKYRAMPGQEDRNGEMTGAISFNMIFVYLPVAIWSIVAPNYLSVTTSIVVGVTAAVVLTIVGIPVSRYFWAHFSDWADRQ